MYKKILIPDYCPEKCDKKFKPTPNGSIPELW